LKQVPNWNFGSFKIEKLQELKKIWGINFFKAGKQGVKGLLFLSLRNSEEKPSIFAENPLVF